MSEPYNLIYHCISTVNLNFLLNWCIFMHLAAIHPLCMLWVQVLWSCTLVFLIYLHVCILHGFSSVCTVKVCVVKFVLHTFIPLPCRFIFAVFLVRVCVSGLWGARDGDEAFWGPGVPATGEREQAGRGEGDPYAAASPGYRRLPAELCHSQGNRFLRIFWVRPGEKCIQYNITMLLYIFI